MLYGTIRFRPDPTGDTPPGGGGDPPAGDPPADPPEPPPTTDPPAPTLTQPEVDEIVKRRLASERKKWQAESDDAAKKATMTETERLRTENEAAKVATAEALTKANATLVRAEAKVAALAAGANPQRLTQVLKLADLSGIEVGEDGEPDAAAVKSAVNAVKKDLPELFGAAASGKDGGSGAADFTGTSDGKRIYSAKDMLTLARNDPGKFRELEADYLNAVGEGRVRD